MADHQTPIIDASEYVELDDKSFLRKEINLNHEHFVKIAEKPENKDYRFKKTEFLKISEIKKIPVREELFIIDANTGKVFGLTQEVGDPVSIQAKNEMISKAMGQLESSIEDSVKNITFDEDFREKVKLCFNENILHIMTYYIPETEKGLRESLNTFARVICEELELEEQSQFLAVKSVLSDYLINLEMFNEIKFRNNARDEQKKKMREEIADSLIADEQYILCNTKALKMNRLLELLVEKNIDYFTKREDIPYIIDRAKQLMAERNKKI